MSTVEERHGQRLRLGVGICALDEEEGLGRLLPRLMGEGPDRADVVVVADGGSTDRSREVTRESGALLLEGARGRGPQLVATADRLQEEAVDVLLFLHADSLPGDGALALVRDAFADPQLVAAGMKQRVDAAGRVFRWIERAADRRVRRGMVFGDSALSVRASEYLAVGGFEPLPLFEDVELSDRLKRRGPIRLLDQAEILVCARRWEQEGVLRCTLRNWILRALHRSGVAPRHLARLYRPFRRASAR